MALSGFQPAELKYASGMFNLMRNLGGAIGIALVNSWLLDNTRISAARFGEALGHDGSAAQDMIGTLRQRLADVTPDAALAGQMAQGLFGHMVGREAQTMAFDDIFRILAWIFIAALVLVPFCRPPANAAPASPEGMH